MKETKHIHEKIRDYTNRWRDMPCSLIQKTNVVKMAIPPKAIYRFNTISTKWPFFTELEQKAVQFVWKHTHTHTHTHTNNQNNLEKGKQSCRNQAL